MRFQQGDGEDELFAGLDGLGVELDFEEGLILSCFYLSLESTGMGGRRIEFSILDRYCERHELDELLVLEVCKRMMVELGKLEKD